ncbi:MAG: hypothetical protein LBJ89_01325 [Holosporales bacterium]|jgi:hypothetical protein|nr:hypothetical protein [Holosporales bacterium]
MFKLIRLTVVAILINLLPNTLVAEPTWQQHSVNIQDAVLLLNTQVDKFLQNLTVDALPRELNISKPVKFRSYSTDDVRIAMEALAIRMVYTRKFTSDVYPLLGQLLCALTELFPNGGYNAFICMLADNPSFIEWLHGQPELSQVFALNVIASFPEDQHAKYVAPLNCSYLRNITIVPPCGISPSSWHACRRMAVLLSQQAHNEVVESCQNSGTDLQISRGIDDISDDDTQQSRKRSGVPDILSYATELLLCDYADEFYPIRFGLQPGLCSVDFLNLQSLNRLPSPLLKKYMYKTKLRPARIEIVSNECLEYNLHSLQEDYDDSLSMMLINLKRKFFPGNLTDIETIINRYSSATNGALLPERWSMTSFFEVLAPWAIKDLEDKNENEKALEIWMKFALNSDSFDLKARLFKLRLAKTVLSQIASASINDRMEPFSGPSLTSAQQNLNRMFTRILTEPALNWIGQLLYPGGKNDPTSGETPNATWAILKEDLISYPFPGFDDNYHDAQCAAQKLVFLWKDRPQTETEQEFLRQTLFPFYLNAVMGCKIDESFSEGNRCKEFLDVLFAKNSNKLSAGFAETVLRSFLPRIKICSSGDSRMALIDLVIPAINRLVNDENVDSYIDLIVHTIAMIVSEFRTEKDQKRIFPQISGALFPVLALLELAPEYVLACVNNRSNVLKELKMCLNKADLMKHVCDSESNVGLAFKIIYSRKIPAKGLFNSHTPDKFWHEFFSRAGLDLYEDLSKACTVEP